MQELTLETRLEQLLANRAHVDVAVEGQDGVLRVYGAVRSAEAREAVTGLLADAAPGYRVVNDLLVADETEPYQSDAGLDANPTPADMSLPVTYWDESTDADRLDEADTGADPMFAAVDPVLTTDLHGRPVVLGGFSSDAMASLCVEPSAEDQLLGDEAIAEVVDRELKQDSATAHLAVHVFVRRGVVHLRGVVAGLEDVDSAEEVAARVPGVREVIEELDLACGG
jgi:osmotically-inducible protein OsmY